MRTVYVGLQRGGGIVGWGNRLVTRSRFGHALIAFDDGMAYSADGRKGWGWLHVADIATRTAWYSFEVTDAQLTSMRRWCEKRVGWRYDWWSVFRFTLLWRLVFPSREAKRDRTALFCSEGVYLCALEAAAIRLLGEVAAWEVAPAHFRFSSLLGKDVPPQYRGPAW